MKSIHICDISSGAGCPIVLTCCTALEKNQANNSAVTPDSPARVTSLQEPLVPHAGVIPPLLTRTAIASIAHIIVRSQEHAGNPFFKVPPIKATSKGKTAVRGVRVTRRTSKSCGQEGPAKPRCMR